METGGGRVEGADGKEGKRRGGGGLETVVNDWLKAEKRSNLASSAVSDVSMQPAIKY